MQSLVTNTLAYLIVRNSDDEKKVLYRWHLVAVEVVLSSTMVMVWTLQMHSMFLSSLTLKIGALDDGGGKS